MLMPTDLKRIREDAGLSLSQMADLLGLEDPRNQGAKRVREFERGVRSISGPVGRLYRLLEAGRIPPEIFTES